MLDNISHYIALYEIKNYAKCAKKLNIQPSTLSKHITGLEAELKQQLIIRTSRKFEVTDFGEYIYNQFKHIPHFIENTINMYNKEYKEQNKSGVLNIALAPDVSYSTVSPYLKKFISKNPRVKLNISFIPLVSTWPSENITILLTLIAIKGENLENRLIRKDYFRLYCSNNYILQYGVPKDIKELHQHKIIGFVNQDYVALEYHKLRNMNTGDEHIIDFRQNKLNTNSILQMIQICKNSYYIFAAPESIVHDDIQKGNLVAILPEWIVHEYEVYVVSKKNVTAIEQSFIDFLYECMGKVSITSLVKD